MKIGFTSKIRAYIFLILSIHLVSNFGLLYLISYSSIESLLRNDISNIIWGSVIIEFSICIFFIANTQNYLEKAISPIKYIISEIAKGSYNVKLDMPIDKDPIILSVYEQIEKMQEIILHYDNLKKEKIVEHRNRILSMLNITDDGIIILNIKGQLLYISDIIKEKFKYFEENVDIINTHFQPEVELSIKKYIMQIIKSHSKLDIQPFYLASMKKHIFMKSSLVRDTRGIPIGIVIGINNLVEKEKA